jgi:hypothetical protein
MENSGGRGNPGGAGPRIFSVADTPPSRTAQGAWLADAGKHTTDIIAAAWTAKFSPLRPRSIGQCD